MPGREIHPFWPLNASLARSSAACLFFALIAAVSSLLSVPFMNPLTFARRFETSLSRFAPERRLRRISCCFSHVSSRPAMSLLLENHPAWTVTTRGRDAGARAEASPRSARQSPRRAPMTAGAVVRARIVK